jgi:hypothetical protein
VLLSSLKDDLVDITMKRLIRQVGEFIDLIPVIVLFVGPLTTSFSVRVSENAGAASVEIESWVLLAVALDKTFDYGVRSSLVI